MLLHLYYLVFELLNETLVVLHLAQCRQMVVSVRAYGLFGFTLVQTLLLLHRVRVLVLPRR